MIQEPRVEEIPKRLPGTCASCGATHLSSGRVWFLDTDMDYFDTPSYAILICNICFDILANTCGYIRKGEEVEQYKREIARLEAELNEFDRYRRIVDLLGLGTERINNLLTLSESPLAEDTFDDLESSTEKRAGTRKTVSSVGRGKKGSSEPLNDEGVAELLPTERDVTITI